MSSLAQRIRDIRYKKGLGPDALAARAEISRTALYQIECGKTEVPRAGTLRRIAQALDVPVDLLLGYRPIEDAVETAASFTPRSVNETNRTSLKADTEWAYPDDPEVTSYPESKRTFVVGDNRDNVLAMLEELLDSRYGDSVARVIQETHKLMSHSRNASASPRAYAEMRYRSTR